MAAPIIKWAGGKRFLVEQISQLLPKRYETYYEPFAGGAAVFFGLEPSRAVLADTNPDLINFYTQLRDRVDDLVGQLQELPNSEDDYYRIRQWSPNNPLERAARFYYLTLLSFNGIYRVNLKGVFNVPYGRKTHLVVADVEKLQPASDLLQNAKFAVGDFETSTANAQMGDIVYFDPPYTVAHNNNGFIKYNENLFSWDDQQRLARVASDLAGRGCHVIVSNAAHQDVRDLYPDFEVVLIERFSVIAAAAVKRTTVQEHLFIKGA